MFTINQPAPNRIDIELSGKLDSDAMRAALDELITKTTDIENGRMLYRITDFAWPSLAAIGVELTRLPGLFRLIGRFDKAAVLASESWLKKASEIEGAMIPGLQIKAFEIDQQQAAEAWLAE